eukprot:577288-Pyramimonas_sp.AAC.1
MAKNQNCRCCGRDLRGLGRALLLPLLRGCLLCRADQALARPVCLCRRGARGDAKLGATVAGALLCIPPLAQTWASSQPRASCAPGPSKRT